MQRDVRLYTVKGCLIFLVVLGHLLERVGGWNWDGLLRFLLTAIYLFHMPAFVFIFGMMSKRRGIAARIVAFAMLLAIYQLAYALLIVSSGGRYPSEFMEPYWILWFLMSMICWTALIPAIEKVPYPVTVAVLIAICAGFFSWAGPSLSISRTLVFLPFFVLGYRRGALILRQSQAVPEWMAAAALLGISAMIYSLGIPHQLFYEAKPYNDMGGSSLVGAAARIGLLALAAITGFMILRLTYVSIANVSRIGRGSLSIFLLHGFAVLAFSRFASRPVANWPSLAIAAALVWFALAIVQVLSIPIFERLNRRPFDTMAVRRPAR
jgi:fucose 4-O-acetylase-like acetyltransferase